MNINRQILILHNGQSGGSLSRCDSVAFKHVKHKHKDTGLPISSTWWTCIGVPHANPLEENSFQFPVSLYVWCWYVRVADVLNSSASLTWKRKASPTELLRQKTKSFLGCSGTAWTMLFSTHSACLWTLLWSIPERPSYSYRKRVQPWRTHKKKGV